MLVLLQDDEIAVSLQDDEMKEKVQQFIDDDREKSVIVIKPDGEFFNNSEDQFGPDEKMCACICFCEDQEEGLVIEIVL